MKLQDRNRRKKKKKKKKKKEEKEKEEPAVTLAAHMVTIGDSPIACN